MCDLGMPRYASYDVIMEFYVAVMYAPIAIHYLHSNNFAPTVNVVQ